MHVFSLQLQKYIKPIVSINTEQSLYEKKCTSVLCLISINMLQQGDSTLADAEFIFIYQIRVIWRRLFTLYYR